MEDFKISHFENETNKQFPDFKSLTRNECESLKAKIAEKYNLDVTNIGRDLLEIQHYIDGLDASENFSLRAALVEFDITPSDEILVNWNAFDTIDKISYQDLDRYFYDIWYPIADDIDVFDHSLNWILSIRHDGIVSFIRS